MACGIRAARLCEELLELQRALDLVELLDLREGGDQVVHLAPGGGRVARGERSHLLSEPEEPLPQLRVAADACERLLAGEEVRELGERLLDLRLRLLPHRLLRIEQ